VPNPKWAISKCARARSDSASSAAQKTLSQKATGEKMKTIIGWFIYFIACCLFAVMALAKKESPGEEL
jgi:hypothetical protein